LFFHVWRLSGKFLFFVGKQKTMCLCAYVVKIGKFLFFVGKQKTMCLCAYVVKIGKQKTMYLYVYVVKNYVPMCLCGEKSEKSEYKLINNIII
jgi:hypothetical protein